MPIKFGLYGELPTNEECYIDGFKTGYTWTDNYVPGGPWVSDPTLRRRSTVNQDLIDRDKQEVSNHTAWHKGFHKGKEVKANGFDVSLTPLVAATYYARHAEEEALLKSANDLLLSINVRTNPYAMFARQIDSATSSFKKGTMTKEGYTETLAEIQKEIKYFNREIETLLDRISSGEYQ